MTNAQIIGKFLRGTDVLLARYLDDLTDDECHRQPAPGVNSAAWVMGHLALIDRRALSMLGVESPELPTGFGEKFGATKHPAGDQSHLGDPGELRRLCRDYRARLISAVEAAPDEALVKPLEKPSAIAATVGEFAAFMGQHAALHLGQVTVLRRSLGRAVVS